MITYCPVEISDVEALLELRATLFAPDAAPGAAGPEAGWVGACRQILLDGLGTGDIAGVVARNDDGLVVGSALARVHRWLPSPTNPTGLKGYVGSWATKAIVDRAAVARELLARLVELLSARGVTEIVVHVNEATADVARGLGFAEDGGITELTRVARVVGGPETG